MIHSHNRAFTVIELMITVGIMSMVMAIVLFSYSKFSERLSLNAAVQEIAIAMRQAQSYGFSVKEAVSGGGNFNSGYGVYFDVTDPQNYYIFVDKDNNQMYDGGASCGSTGDCLVQKNPLRNAVSIVGVCGGAFGGSLNCPPDANDPAGQSVKAMSIIFSRPGLNPSQSSSPDATIRFIRTNNTFYGGAFQTGRVNLRSLQGSVVGITVENTGQISTQ